MENNDYKKYFLKILIAALLISALIGIFIFLSGDFREIQIKLLLTTLTIGGYSLTGLCSSTLQNRKELKVFSKIGMLVSVLGFMVTIGGVWEINYFNHKIILIFIILSAAIGHISLLLQIRPKANNIRYSLIATIIFISIVGLMLIKLALADFDKDESELYFRLLGVFSILDVLGTIVTPILNKITHKKE